MIVLTGTTGKLGGTIVDRLLARHPEIELGASVRDVTKAAALAERGVRVRHGDYADPSSLHGAFEGAETLLLVSSNTIGEATVRNHRNAIEAAKAVGVRRIVYTSHMGANPASPFPPMAGHDATERMLADSGLEFVSLRNGFYADSGLMLMGNALETGEIVAPADGPVSWTTHADLAEAAAIALVDATTFRGITPPLTASEALDLDDLAALASEITGRSIRRVTLGDDAFRASLVARGVPEERLPMILGLYAASRERGFAAVDPTLGRVLSRPPVSMRAFLTERLSR